MGGIDTVLYCVIPWFSQLFGIGNSVSQRCSLSSLSWRCS